MIIEIDGQSVATERNFHDQIAAILDVQQNYGYNLDALWDLLSAGIERPLSLNWIHSHASRINMGENFSEVIEVLERVRLQDLEFGWEDRFTYSLE